MRLPPITAGEVERNAWCAVCQAPTRLRVPLVQRGRQAGVLEICPGCGTGHDQAAICVTPGSAPLHARHPLATLARKAHRWACSRRGLLAVECAHGTCPWPGLWRHAHEMDGDDGTWRYVFCRASHKRAWAAAHGLLLP